MEDVDLPMLSNINVHRVRHYMIKYEIDIKNNFFTNETILFLNRPTDMEIFETSGGNQEKLEKTAIPNTSKFDREVILDCCNLNIHNVYEIICPDEILSEYMSNPRSWGNERFSFWITQPQHQCIFKVNKWSLHINLKQDDKKHILLRIVCSSQKSGRSINWRIDEDNNTCVFTAGSRINNRSIIPSQDNPIAMATWEAIFFVPEYYYVSCTGDSPPIINYKGAHNMASYYYCSTMPMPIATFALAIGKWIHQDVISKELAKEENINSYKYQNHNAIKCYHQDYSCNIKCRDSGPLIEVSVVAPSSLIDKARHILQHCKNILKASYHLLGNHPFCRLQFVVLPRSFSCLGLASPNIIFISPSILYEDSNMLISLAHEISHTWFGILIGPKNWNEEWLSEGFASYVESYIYLQTLIYSNGHFGDFGFKVAHSTTNQIKHELVQLRGCVKYLKLIGEESSTDEALLTLSPSVECTSITKNALDSSKSFLQVHYLKGSFLLSYLSQLVGSENFMQFLKLYLLKFHGCLVTSEEFFTLFYEEFPHVNETVSYDVIYVDWLSNPKVNCITKSIGQINDNNSLIASVLEHFNYIKTFLVNAAAPNAKLIFSDQLVLLLELLLDLETLSVPALNHVFSFYEISNKNAEIKHRWCELIIKHDHHQLKDVESFLIDNQSMGVYLYGELIISNNSSHIKLAKDIFLYLKPELDPTSKDIISEMLGTE